MNRSILVQAIASAATTIPGATFEGRPAVETPTIVLPALGVTIVFKCTEAPTMHLCVDGAEIVFCNVPTVAKNVGAAGRRISRAIRGLVEGAIEQIDEAVERRIRAQSEAIRLRRT